MITIKIQQERSIRKNSGHTDLQEMLFRISDAKFANELKTQLQILPNDHLQVHSWHQLSCDAENQDVSHEKHILTVVAHYHHCQDLHFGQGKPERSKMRILYFEVKAGLGENCKCIMLR